MKLTLSLKCSTRVGIYGCIESKSKHVGFYLVVHVHFMGRSVYGTISANIFTEIYFDVLSTSGNLMITLWTVQFSASCYSNAGSVIQDLY
jgi:hypothetical protein